MSFQTTEPLEGSDVINLLHLGFNVTDQGDFNNQNLLISVEQQIKELQQAILLDSDPFVDVGLDNLKEKLRLTEINYQNALNNPWRSQAGYGTIFANQFADYQRQIASLKEQIENYIPQIKGFNITYFHSTAPSNPILVYERDPNASNDCSFFNSRPTSTDMQKCKQITGMYSSYPHINPRLFSLSIGQSRHQPSIAEIAKWEAEWQIAHKEEQQVFELEIERDRLQGLEDIRLEEERLRQIALDMIEADFDNNRITPICLSCPTREQSGSNSGLLLVALAGMMILG